MVNSGIKIVMMLFALALAFQDLPAAGGVEQDRLKTDSCSDNRPRTKIEVDAARNLFAVARRMAIDADSAVAIASRAAGELYGFFEADNSAYYASARTTARAAVGFDSSRPSYHLLLARLEWFMSSRGDGPSDTTAENEAISSARCARKLALMQRDSATTRSAAALISQYESVIRYRRP